MKIGEKMNDAKRVEFAKQIETMYEATTPSWKRVILPALVRGVAMGAGTVIGGTLVIALVAWILGSLDNLPFLGNIAENAKDSIQTER